MIGYNIVACLRKAVFTNLSFSRETLKIIFIPQAHPSY